ncbi:MAG: type II toxin-antitoxin system HicB family antitoxin [Opitutales bacterium]
MLMRIPVILEKEPHTDYAIRCPALPLCFSTGETVNEAIRYYREALTLCFETFDEGKGSFFEGPLELETYASELASGECEAVLGTYIEVDLPATVQA